MRSDRRVLISWTGPLAAAWLAFAVPALAGEDRVPANEPNYQQAMRFNSQYLRQFVYDTSVTPRWIGKTDTFWYAFRTSAGTQYWRVDPRLATKTPLFDRVKLGAQLSEAVQKPLDPAQLPLQRVALNDEGTKLRFVADDFQYEYDLTSEKLVKQGKAPAISPTGPPGASMSREEFERRREEFLRQRDDQQRQQDERRQDQDQQQQDQQQQDQQQRQDDQRGEGAGPPTGRGLDHRNWSPDRKAYVFAKGHNLHYVEVPEPEKKAPEKTEVKPEAKKDETKKEDVKKEEAKKEEAKKDETTKEEAKKDETKKEEAKKEEAKKDETKKDETKKDETKKDETKKEDIKKEETKKEETKTEQGQAERKQDDPEGPQQRTQTTRDDQGGPRTNTPPIPRVDPKLDDTATQLTTDGAEDYSFAGGFGGFGRGTDGGSRQSATPPDPNRKSRPNVTWSADSKSFYVTRSDARGVQDLWVVNSLANPRPTLEKYKYPMPGEPAIRKSELYTFTKASKKLTRVAPKWKDENHSNLHFGKSGDELRFLRRDRLLRHIEFCSLNLVTGEAKCLIAEGFENANVLNTQYRYLDETDEMIWWSERTGWGHFYLHGRDGTLKNAITSGPYRASRIVDVDVKNRMLYFLGNGREPNENIYHEHLYCVRLDGTGLSLMDPGPASHRSTLSPSRQYLVDNFSRVDMAPKAVLREASGKEIMALEEADLSRLVAAGWHMPETFTVKAADGVTDLYGNMWKPFDFDPNKKYPIIANVYPGPQTEGTTHTFAASGGTMQLAQVGFIVIQVGHRGGAPTRSKAYASYGYFNLRDFGLEDKKSAIEQLAARHPFIDINRVGIYGHSGGGFMTAAALLQKPYNEFFKVGVSTSGNHDNNIYNNSWSERYHGLKEVPAEERKTQVAQSSQAGDGRRERPGEDDEGAEGLLQTEGEDLFEEAAYEELLTLINPEWVPPPTLNARFGGRPQDQDKKVDEKKVDEKKVDEKKAEEKKSSQDAKTEEKKTKFEIKVPTNQELAANLKGKLLLIHGEIDNNVHPANTMRLVDALIKANKRFDMLMIPGKRHSYGDYQPYTTQRTWEYFAEHLMGDRQTAADIYEKAPANGARR